MHHIDNRTHANDSPDTSDGTPHEQKKDPETKSGWRNGLPTVLEVFDNRACDSVSPLLASLRSIGL